MELNTIVSGGQTGVDRGALDAALGAGFRCGGWCPADRQSEDGRIPSRYPMAELDAGGYAERTVRNLLDSDGTLILFRGEPDGGTRLTKTECERRNRPWLALDALEHEPLQAASIARTFVESRGIATLNVAGPRASKWPEGAAYAEAVIAALIRMVRDADDAG